MKCMIMFTNCTKRFPYEHTNNHTYTHINQYQMHNKYETLFIFTMLQFQLNQSSVIPFYPLFNGTSYDATHNSVVNVSFAPSNTIYDYGCERIVFSSTNPETLGFCLHKSLVFSSHSIPFHFHFHFVSFSAATAIAKVRISLSQASSLAFYLSLRATTNVFNSNRTNSNIWIHLFCLRSTCFCQNIC